MTLGWVLRYGSAFDPAGKGGLTYLLSQILGKATLDKTSKDIQSELNLLGAELQVQSDWDRIVILLRGHSATFERALLLLYQIVGEAQFLQEDLDAARAERLSQLEGPEDPRQRVRSQFEIELFSGMTYGRSPRGSRDTLENIILGDLKRFYSRYFSSNEAALVIAASAPAEVVLQKAARIWGVWVRKEAVPFTFLPPRAPASRSVVFEDDPQSPAAQFALGSLCPSRGDSAYGAVMLASRVLQERLTRALPTSLLTVSLDARRMPGPFYIQGQAAADQAVEQILKVLETVEELKTSGISTEELQAAQARWIQDFQQGIGSSDSVCNYLLEAEVYRLGTNYIAMFEDAVRRYDPDAVRQAAKEWLLPDGLLLLVRGPAVSLKPGLSALGNLRQSAP